MNVLTGRGPAVKMMLAMEDVGEIAAGKAAGDVEQKIGALQRYLASLPDKLILLCAHVVMALVMFVIGTRVIAFLRRFVRRALEKANASETAVQFLDSAIRAVLYVVLIFSILQIFGLEAASIATVIGSVGVTVGLAIQGSLSNCIGGILLLTLKPFKVGDYIIEDTQKNEGVVQQINIFYTKLSTLDNKVIFVPNGSLANTSLTNVTDAPMRRADFTIGIAYQASISRARQTVERLAAAHPLVLDDPAPSVYVDHFGDSSVVLGVRLWAKKENFWQARCEMMEQVKTAFDEEGITIPFNQLDVHLVPEAREQGGGAGAATVPERSAFGGK